MKKIYWWLYVVRLSARWIPQLNLGRNVWWRGEKWMLVQGVCAPAWDLARGNERSNHINESDFRAVQNPVEWWLAFMRGYRFYMTSWYRIWVNSGIEPWMRGCNIWADRKPNDVAEPPEAKC